jgi:hypothetical protein
MIIPCFSKMVSINGNEFPLKGYGPKISLGGPRLIGFNLKKPSF